MEWPDVFIPDTSESLFSVNISELRQRNLQRNMQTQENSVKWGNKDVKENFRSSHINIIKLIPSRHQLFYLLDVILNFPKALHYCAIPIRHSTWFRNARHQICQEMNVYQTMHFVSFVLVVQENSLKPQWQVFSCGTAADSQQHRGKRSKGEQVSHSSTDYTRTEK